MNFKNPDHRAILERRRERYARLIEAPPEKIELLRLHYRTHPVDFIHDWGMTSDPRNARRGLSPVMPLIPFPRQAEWIEWVYERWTRGEDGVSDKSRDMGLSWTSAAFGSWMALFYPDSVIGYGSRKEEYVDKVGSPKTLFWKIRQFLAYVPPMFRGGFVENAKFSAHMRINIPGTNSTLAGEAGSNIGRGDRTSIYFVDESAFLPQAELVDAALSQTTDCRIDLSSVNGMDNPFAQKRHSWPARQVFTFHWRDDPRKDQAWYDAQCARLSPVVVAQEIDLDYNASKEGIVIPAEWVQAAVDLHKLPGFEWLAAGARQAAYDVADQGVDLNAFAWRTGHVVQGMRSWSGAGSTISDSVRHVCHQFLPALSLRQFTYDATGLGAAVPGDVKRINEAQEKTTFAAIPFHGGGSVVNAEQVAYGHRTDAFKGRTNGDLFKNRKSQGWWHLRDCFENAWLARNGKTYDRERLISLDKAGLGDEFSQLVAELSQPTFRCNDAGQILIDKAPEGMRSPNHADAVMILCAPRERPVPGFFNRKR